MNLEENADLVESRTYSLLLVDDEVSILRTLGKIFREHKYTILTASCAAEAQAVLKHEKVDLVISDNLMSGTFGVDFLKSVRENSPEIKLIMLSGYVPRNFENDLLENNYIDRLLVKPCESKKLLRVVAELLSERTERVVSR